MNHKKLRRIYREEKLQVRRRGGRKRALGMRAPMAVPQGPNQRWSLTPTASGYLIVNAHSGLPMTTASTTDGSKVTQEATTGATGQQWTVN